MPLTSVRRRQALHLGRGEPDQPGVAEDTGVAEGDLARVELRRGGSNMDPKRALTIINTREVGRTPSQLQWIGYSWYPF